MLIQMFLDSLMMIGINRTKVPIMAKKEANKPPPKKT